CAKGREYCRGSDCYAGFFEFW
nr:immunoglobulin heavy chain junction region [Macaca mulatta]MOW75351.1 immunoglobulin heavy chain junction region [Macaca mulatta]MOW81819.1 immunoglobulin heavy chain junction region [Macaca mulatta]